MALALGLALVSGCAQIVAGRVRPGPDLIPTPVIGKSVRQALLDDAELSEMFHTTFESNPKSPPRFGGIDELTDSWASAVPHDCVGVAAVAPRNVYRSLQVQETAWESWRNRAIGTAEVSAVGEAVVALPTTADARSAFETFSGQWSGCGGATITRDNRSDPVTIAVSDVAAADSVLAATAHATVRIGDRTLGMWSRRALGVQGNCLVDVQVFFGADDRPTEDSAPGVARAMMDKIDRLGVPG